MKKNKNQEVVVDEDTIEDIILINRDFIVDRIIGKKEILTKEEILEFLKKIEEENNKGESQE